MAFISEQFQLDRLKKYKISIKTKYIVGNNILERNTTNGNNDDIKNGIKCEKNYYINNKLVHTEKVFDTRMEYTFISKDEENKDYTCPNCGMNSKLKDFIDGCPYCKTYYNIDYTDKDLGSKYHYDLILKKNTYRVFTAIIDIIISIILSYILIKTTSRTFNNYDITKVFIYGGILSLILYYFFYIIDAYIILSPIKNYKNKQNQRQIEFWKKTKIDKKLFFNNLNYEIRKKYYSNDNIIDYDILDFTEYSDYYKDDKYYIKVNAYVRIMYYKNNKIVSKYIDDTYTLRKLDNSLKVNNGVNLIKCHNCGASIDINKNSCEYCESEIKYLQEFIME